MSIGSDLRQAREQLGLSLRDISERTKIRQPMLRAIEIDDFAHAPGGVIMRGFLKLYAREVGLDADAIATRYLAQLEDGLLSSPETGTVDASSTVRTARVAAGVAVVALLGLLGYLALRPVTVTAPSDQATRPAPSPTAPSPRPAPPSASARPEEPPTAAAPPAAAPAAPPPATTAPADRKAAHGTPEPAASGPSSGVRVDLQATGDCWIAATADGEQVAYRMMRAGDRLEIRATSEAVLRIGIPGNMTVSINNRAMRPLARPGTPTTVTITPANYRELVAQ